MNIAIIVISHGPTSQHLINTVDTIVGEKSLLHAFQFISEESPEQQRQRLSQLIQQADRGSGALLLSDVAGATPCNACRPLLEANKVAMVCGYNLPMLLKLAKLRESFSSPEELAAFIADYGQKNIRTELGHESSNS